MIELAAIERWLVGLLTPIGGDHGIGVLRIPFLPAAPGSAGGMPTLPVIYWGHTHSVDRSAIGPGPRILTSALYEVGVYHQGVGFGAVFPPRPPHTAAVSLLSLLSRIDAALQDHSAPTTNPTGMVYACYRERPICVPETGPEGHYYRRDGGLWRITARKV